MRGIAKDRVYLVNAEHIAREAHRKIMGQSGGMDHLLKELDDPSYTTVHSQLTTAKHFPLDTLRAAHFVTGSKTLESYLLWPGLCAIPDPRLSPPTDDPEKETGDIYLSISNFHATMREALKDGRIDATERSELRRRLAILQGEIAELATLLEL